MFENVDNILFYCNGLRTKFDQFSHNKKKSTSQKVNQL